LVHLPSGLPFSEALWQDKHSGASVGDEHVVRDVFVLEVNASVGYSLREVLHAVAELKDKTSHWELAELVYFHATFLSAVTDSRGRCSLDGEGGRQVVCLRHFSA